MIGCNQIAELLDNPGGPLHAPLAVRLSNTLRPLTSLAVGVLGHVAHLMPQGQSLLFQLLPSSLFRRRLRRVAVSLGEVLDFLDDGLNSFLQFFDGTKAI